MLLEGLSDLTEEPDDRHCALIATFLRACMDRAPERPPSPGVSVANTPFAFSRRRAARRHAALQQRPATAGRDAADASRPASAPRRTGVATSRPPPFFLLS